MGKRAEASLGTVRTARAGVYIKTLVESQSGEQVGIIEPSRDAPAQVVQLGPRPPSHSPSGLPQAALFHPRKGRKQSFWSPREPETGVSPALCHTKIILGPSLLARRLHSAGPGLPVLRVLGAPVILGQRSRQRGQVGG